MGELRTCPLCRTTVAHTGALRDHLATAHNAQDAIGYLLEPGRVRVRLPVGRWSALASGLAAFALAVAVVGPGLGGDDPAEVAATGTAPSEQSDTAETAAPDDQEPDQDDASTSTGPAGAGTDVDTVPSAPSPVPTVPATDSLEPGTTAVSSTTPEDATPPTLPIESFQLPFLLDAAVASCDRSDGHDVYEIAVLLAGASDIILEGIPFPGESADGSHTIAHVLPAGATGFLDHLDIADGAGTVHRLAVLPPIPLGGCD